jgi:hypothetical protein
MLDALKTLFENNVVSEEIRADIEDAWNKKIDENKKQVTAELREEFARKYEHDKQTMVESIDKMLEESLAGEIAEFQEDRKQLAEAKAKYAVAMRDHSEKLEGFIMEQLSAEVSELHEDQKQVAAKFEKLEEFVIEALTKEISEFYTDKKDLAETKVKLMRESRNAFDEVKKDFIKTSAKLVNKTVSESLKTELSQLKEDITIARQNDFGRRLFESFQQEYVGSHLNKKSETARLLNVVAEKEAQLKEAEEKIAEAKKLSESKNTEIKLLKESAVRTEKVNELLSPLSRKQKEIMTDLLESVQTAKLETAFNKYLPAVIDGDAPKAAASNKAKLTEGKEVTGNKETNNNISSTADDNNVVDIKRLAGLK